MEKTKEEKKTFRNSKKDPLGFRVRSKNGLAARRLFTSGLNFNEVAEELASYEGKETPLRIAKSTLKTFLSDISLEPGSFSPSRGIELEEKGGIYRVKDSNLRRKLRKKYREFYAPESEEGEA